MPLIFEEHTGRLLDGQNRLQAIAETGRSQQFVVCDNAGPEIMQAIDQGASRSASDHLTTRGIFGGASLAPLLLAIIGYARDPQDNWSVIKPVSNEEYVEAYEANPLLIEEADGQGKRCNKEFRLISRTDFSVFILLNQVCWCRSARCRRFLPPACLTETIWHRRVLFFNTVNGLPTIRESTQGLGRGASIQSTTSSKRLISTGKALQPAIFAQRRWCPRLRSLLSHGRSSSRSRQQR